MLVALNGTVGGANTSAAQLVAALPGPYEGCIVHPSGLEPTPEILDATPRVGVAYLPGWYLAPGEPLLARWRWYLARNVRSGVHLRSVTQLAALARRWQVSLVHTNTALTLSPALAARALGLAHVWHVRELIGRGATHAFPPGDAATARIIGALSHRIVANSNASAAFLRRHLGDEAVTVVPNGITPPAADPAEPGRALRASLGLLPGDRVVGMVAALSSEWKGHRHVLGAFARVRTPGAKLVLFGSAPDTAYVRALRASAAGDPRVIVAGHIADPWAAMGALDVLVHGAIEPFGRVFVEAMLAGKPVVAPRGGGASEIVQHGVTGYLCDPEDPADLAEHVRRLLSDPALLHGLGAAGQARARAVYAFDSYVSAMARVYDEAKAVHARRS